MAYADYTRAVALIDRNKDLSFFVGPRSEALIRQAEAALGGALPAIYRDFVARFGAGSFGASEVYGITSSDFEISSVPNGIWLTLMQRKAGVLPSHLLVVGATGDGAFHCIGIGTAETTVRVVSPARGVEFPPEESVAADFGEHLLRLVESELSS
jgi:hypothetical protein